MPITQEGGKIGLLGTMRVQFFTWYNFQIAINTVHYRWTADDGINISYGQVAQVFSALAKPFYLQTMGGGARYLGCKTSTTSIGNLEAPGIFSDEQAVNLGIDPITSGVTGLIKFTTNRRGQSYRGRLYMPFLDSSQVNQAGEVDPQTVTAYTQFAVALYTLIALLIDGKQVDTRMIIKSSKPVEVGTVNSGAGQTRVATQRRRSARGGLNQPIIT